MFNLLFGSVAIYALWELFRLWRLLGRLDREEKARRDKAISDRIDWVVARARREMKVWDEQDTKQWLKMLAERSKG